MIVFLVPGQKTTYTSPFHSGILSLPWFFRKCIVLTTLPILTSQYEEEGPTQDILGNAPSTFKPSTFQTPPSVLPDAFLVEAIPLTTILAITNPYCPITQAEFDACVNALTSDQNLIINQCVRLDCFDSSCHSIVVGCYPPYNYSPYNDPYFEQ
ncbi:hypothetical protein ACLOJK_006759 [Asimina triloba]